MGLLIDGIWHDQWYDASKTGGEFVRQDARFRNWVTPDGEPGPTGSGGFKAESGRYHLYLARACPWAHRTLIFRMLKQLEDVMSISIVEPEMLEHGWEFTPEPDGDFGDPVNNARYLHQIYTLAEPEYTGRVTVPVLWDKQRQTIVNNESSEIIRMLNSAFGACTENRDDYYPEPYRPNIDAINQIVYENVNNGVYRCGFATTQEAYDRAFDRLFETLGELEKRLSGQRYLVGERLTEADWRLFTTLIRFDAVYYSHFKTNLRRIVDYPNLSNYVRELFQHPGVADTVDFHQIKRHYYYSHNAINPTRIVPKGPEQDLWAPHDRGQFQAKKSAASGGS